MDVSVILAVGAHLFLHVRAISADLVENQVLPAPLAQSATTLPAGVGVLVAVHVEWFVIGALDGAALGAADVLLFRWPLERARRLQRATKTGGSALSRLQELHEVGVDLLEDARWRRRTLQSATARAKLAASSGNLAGA